MIFRALDPDRYADNTAPTADSGPELQRIATRVNEARKEFGMKLNVKKTKTTVISKKAVVARENIALDGQMVEQVS